MNHQMSILKAIGIIFVVLGHKKINFHWLPIYSFHMPLFFFISGYLYKEKYDSSHLLFIKKKAKSLLFPYFICNTLFLVITILVNQKFGISLGKKINGFNFFIEPFITGHQYYFFLAAWFVTQLFIVHVLYNLLSPLLKKVGLNSFFKLLFFLGLALVAIYLCNKGHNKSFFLVLFRSFFGMFFYYLGFYFKNNLEKYNVYRSTWLILFVLFQYALVTHHKSLHFSMLRADFSDFVYLPIISSITGIYFCLFLSKSLSLLFKSKDLLVEIGNNSFHVMAGHIFVFFVFNYAVLKLTGGNMQNLGNIWFSYDNNRFWFAYVAGGVLIPTYLSLAVKKINNKFFCHKTT